MITALVGGRLQLSRDESSAELKLLAGVIEGTGVTEGLLSDHVHEKAC
jgi:hypothetical protein